MDRESSLTHPETPNEYTEEPSTIGKEVPSSPLVRYLEEAGLENVPAIHIELFLTGHTTRNDALALREALLDADIFIPELVNITAEQKRQIQEISDGTMAPLTFFLQHLVNARNTQFIGGLLNMIHGSKLRIGTVDLPNEHPLLNDIEAHTKVVDSFLEMLAVTPIPYASAMALWKDLLLADVAVNKKREAYITRQVAPEIASIILNDSQLQQHQAIKVVIFAGSVHAPLLQSIRTQAHPDIRLTYPTGRYPSSSLSILSRIINLRGASGVPDELVEVLLTEEILLRTVFETLATEPVFRTTADSLTYLRRTIASFSAAERRELYAHYTRQGKDGCADYVTHLLHTKGIPLPTDNPETVYDYIENQRHRPHSAHH